MPENFISQYIKSIPWHFMWSFLEVKSKNLLSSFIAVNRYVNLENENYLNVALIPKGIQISIYISSLV